jgi:hypothetical protein
MTTGEGTTSGGTTMHPVLAQETIRDYSNRRQRAIEAAARHDHHSTREAEEDSTPPTPAGARTSLRTAITMILARPKRSSLSHP